MISKPEFSTGLCRPTGDKRMEFLVKLLKIVDIKSPAGRASLYANCIWVSESYWLFEGDQDSLHESIDFDLIDEQHIEGFGDLTQIELVSMVSEIYGNHTLCHPIK